MKRATKSRNTKQRAVILAELSRVTSHPTADQLYAMVRRRLPRISMGTVYRNLELLADEGAIQKLEGAGKQKHFDGNAKSHYHVRCLDCGKIADLRTVQNLPLAEVVVENAARELNGFEILGHRLELVGLCPRCKRRSSSPEWAYRFVKKSRMPYSTEK